MSGGFQHACIASIPEYKKDVTRDSVAMVFRAYTCVWRLTSSETFRGLSRPILLTSVQYSSDPVQFTSINDEFCNFHCFFLQLLTLQSTASTIQSVPRGKVSILEGHSTGYFKQKKKCIYVLRKTKSKLRGFSPQANYTDRATTACRRS
jgi:hypothetical protein